MNSHTQIFQANDSKRWRSFKWSLRIILMIFLFFLLILVIALVRGFLPSIPNLEAKSRAYQEKMDPSNPFTFSQTYNKKYKGFKVFLDKKIKEDSLKKARQLENKTIGINQIRAAFYTPWNSTTSLPDLKKNGNKLNVIFPEWFFIDPVTHNLQTRIDSAGLTLMRKQHLKIMPIVSNYNSFLKPKPDFDGSLLHQILNEPGKRKSFIKQLSDTLSFYQLSGINVDFEELKEKSNKPLADFQKELFESLHEKNFTVTQDVAVDNDDYDYAALSNYNDYIILMAYDQFNDASSPGPVSSQKWIEQKVDEAAKKIDPKKIILGIAGYGYNWTKYEDGKTEVESITYDEAINLAKIKNAPIDFDNDTYNLHFSYTDQEPNDDSTFETLHHQIWVADAATTFNVLRFSDEYATAGTALWRLGSEDARMWTYYNRSLSNADLASNPFDFNSLVTIPIIPDNVGLDGEGELLNIIASPQEGKIKLEVDSTELLISEQNYTQLPSGYIIQKFAEDKTPAGPGHKLILTFDDGPDPEWTPQVLDILEKEKVPATFFVVGLQAEKNIPLLQRINKLGFEIGNHTFTHSNVAKMSPQRAALEMKLTRLLIESVTGRSTILFRAPYNADSEPHTFEELEPIERSRQENYLTVGESIDPNDWQVGVSADTIVARTIQQVEDRQASIILLHDAGGVTRKATIEALPRIIDYFKKRGYQFTTVANLMGKTRDDVMPKIPPTKDGWLSRANFFFAETTYWGSHIIFALFIVGIALSVGRMLLMAALAAMQKRKEAKKDISATIKTLVEKNPLVSIIVPAYNEEVNAVRTVMSLLQQDYSNLQVIFVDDGSKDGTYQKVKDAFMGYPNVLVYTKPNGGKASALNYGIEKASSDYVVCIDADTQLKSDAVTQLMREFDFRESSKASPLEGAVGAVAGNVKVGNEVNMITRWQSIEYITAQNFDRRAFDLLNCITVVPGAIGAFRKEAIIQAGGFTTDTLAEDCDLTMRLHRIGYQVRNCTAAISYTEAPETLKQFLKQRFRWSFGVMQCFWKHRDAVFNPRYKNFGMVALPNILIFQLILPFLAPLADLLLVVSLISAGLGIIPADISHIVFYYFIFTLVDMAGAALAFAFEQSGYKKLWWMIPQRLVYRQLMYYILIKSFSKAIKGELQGWGALKRTGNVKQVATA